MNSHENFKVDSRLFVDFLLKYMSSRAKGHSDTSKGYTVSVTP